MRNIIIGFVILFTGLLSPLYAQNSIPEVESGKIRIKFTTEMVQSFQTIELPTQDTRINLTGVASVDDFNAQQNIKSFKRVFPFSLTNEAKHRKHGLHLWYEVDFDESIDPQQMVQTYKQLAGSEIVKPVYKKSYIEPNQKFIPAQESNNQRTANSYFNDPMLSNQWHYENDGSIVGTEDADIDLFEAWKTSTGLPHVVVAIVDGGIDTNHNDIKGSLWVNEVELNGEPGVDDDQNGYVDDINGYNFVAGGNVSATDHGTHVGGTVAARSNNGIGVAGVAGGDGTAESGARLMSCQIFLQAGASSGAENAYVYAADNGAVIAQSSWSYNTPGFFEEEVMDAIDYFVEEAGHFEGSPMKGGIVFFSAGNTGTNHIIYPSAHENVTAVAAFDPYLFPTQYTTHGDWVDILAPGGSTFEQENEGVLSTVPGNNYAYFQGTSMACPHVSGVAALVLSEFGHEEYTPEELRKRIVDFSNPFPNDMHEYWNGLLGKGVLNADNSMSINDGAAPEKVVLNAENVYHDSFDITWLAPNDSDDGTASQFYVWFSEVPFTKDNYQNLAPYVFENNLDKGEKFVLSIGNTREKLDFYFAVMSEDKWGNTSELSEILKVTTADAPRLVLAQDSLFLSIDVSKQSTLETSLFIQNTNNGTLKWEAFAKNYGYIPTEISDQISQDDTNDGLAKVIYKENGFPTIQLYQPAPIKKIGYASPDQSLTTNIAIQNIQREDDFYNYPQITEYSAGLFYDRDEWPTEVLGPESAKTVNFVHATRYEIASDYTFNLTHVAAFTNITNTEEPIIIEIRKGSASTPTNAQTIHTQEYTPTETGLNWLEIPLTRNFRFEDSEVFWIVMHHPLNEPYPITSNRDYIGNPGRMFWISKNGGRTFEDVQNLSGGIWYYLLKVRALSTGNDGAWIYVDPVSGEVGPNQSSSPTMKIDPSTLVNGKHRSAVGFYTNDPNYPAATIFLELEVTGQKTALEFNQINELNNAFVGVNSRHTIDIKNKGLGDLIIFDGNTDIDGLTIGIKDTLQVSYNETYALPIQYQPSSFGMQQGYITLNTNEGELKLLVTANVSNPAILSISDETLNLSKAFDSDPFTQTFTIKNEGEYPLEYRIPTDLFEKYEANHDNLRDYFENGWYPPGDRDGKPRNVESIYTYITSDEEDGPIAGAFEDISLTGTSIRHITLGFTTARNIPIGFHFPFFDDTYDHINIHADGVVAFGKIWDGATANRNISFPYTNTAEGAIALLWKNFDPIYDFRSQEWGGDIFYENRGDAFIIQYDNITSLSQDGRMTLQLVLYKNGDFEMRFKDIEQGEWYNQALVGIQNIEEDYGITIQSSSESKREYDFVSPIKDEMVIRFLRHENEPFIVEATPSNGLLLPNEEQEITLSIDPQKFRLYDGIHHNKLFIFNNSSDDIAELPINLTINGEEEINVENHLVDFGKVVQYESIVDSIIIENSGSKQVQVIGYNDLSAFTVLTPMPFSLNPESRNRIDVQYTPSNSGTHEENLIFTLDNGDEYQIALKGSAFENPSPILSSNSLDINLKAGESTTKTINLQNSSNDYDLLYTLQARNYAQIKDLDYSTIHPTDTLKFVYGIADTQEDENPLINYQWESIVEESNKIEVQSDAYHHYKLPFSFLFYGEYYEDVWMNEQGFLTVVEPEISTSNTYALFVKGDNQRGIIAPKWAHFEPNPSSKSAGLYIKGDEEKVIFEWYDMTSQYGLAMPGSATFQAVLYATGQIEFKYEKVDDFDGEFNFGMESPNELFVQDLGRSGVDYEQVFNTEFNDKRSILLTPPAKGTIASNKDREFTILFDGTTLYDGIYNDTLFVLSNSTLEDSLVEIPIQINVTGQSKFAFQETLELDKIYYLENIMVTDTLLIENKGTKSFEIDSLIYDNSLGYTIKTIEGENIQRNKNGKVFSTLEVKSKSELLLLFEYTPESLGELRDEIVVVTNEGDKGTTLLSAQVVAPPMLEVPIQDTTFIMTSQDEINATFDLLNKGLSTLDYKAEVIYKLKEGQSLPELEEGEELTFADSIVNEHINNDVAAGYWASLGGAPTSVASKLKSPKGGFLLSHVRSNVDYINEGTFFVRVEVYIGGEDPSQGELLRQEDIEFEAIYGPTWMTWALDKGVFIPENTEFWLVVHHPPLYFKAGFEVDYSSDYNIEDHLVSFDLGNVWGYDPLNPRVWKSRALSQTANEGWLSLDQYENEIAPNSQNKITATVNNEYLGSGDQWAIIRLKNNDPTQKEVDINFYVNTNKVPYFSYLPVQEGENIFVREGEEKVVNIIAHDPENDQLSFSLDSMNEYAKIVQVNDSIAQIYLQPDYDTEGKHVLKVFATDSLGQSSSVELGIEIQNTNRAPEVVQLNDFYLNASAKELKLIDINDIVYDLDEDQLGVFVQNFHPELIELAYSDNEVVIIPKEEGIALIAYGADDFNGGFSYKFAYVVVEGSITGIEDQLTYRFHTFPNPAKDQSMLELQLKQATDVEIQLFNLQGQVIKNVLHDFLPSGNHTISTSVDQLNAGIYIYKIVMDAYQSESIKVIVE